MISDELAELTGYLQKNQPASEAEIKSFVNRIGFAPPADYLEFMRTSNGAYGEGERLVFLHSLEEALRAGPELGVPDKVVVFGSDGGSVSYAFDGRKGKVAIVTVDHYGPTVEKRLAGSFTEMLKKLRAQREKAERESEKKSKLPPMIVPAGPDASGEIARVYLKELDDSVTGISFAEDGSSIAITSGRSLEVWSAGGGRQLMRRDLAGESWSGYGAVYLDAPRKQVKTFHNEGVITWDASSGTEVSHFRFGVDYAGQARRFVSRGQKLVVSVTGQGIFLWDLPAQRIVYEMRDKQHNYHFAQSPDGQWLAYATYGAQRHEHLVRIIELASGKVMAEIPVEGFHAPLTAFSADGRLVIGGSVADVSWIDVPSGKVTARFKLGLGTDEGLKTLAVAAGGRIVAGTYDWLGLFDGATGALVHRFETFEKGRGPEILAVSPDGKTLATSGRHDLGIKPKAVVRLWRVGR